ncbi:unnamed protein product [Caenorhabditis nigoni]
MACQLAIPDQRVLNTQYEGFSNGVSSLNIQYRSEENSPALSEWIMDAFPPTQGDDYLFQFNEESPDALIHFYWAPRLRFLI